MFDCSYRFRTLPDDSLDWATEQMMALIDAEYDLGKLKHLAALHFHKLSNSTQNVNNEPNPTTAEEAS